MYLFYFCQILALNIYKYDKIFTFYNYFVILSVKTQRLTPCKEVHQGIEWSMTARCFPLFNASSRRSWMTNSLPTQKAMICGKVRGVTRRKARLNVLVVTSKLSATTITSTILPRTTSHCMILWRSSSLNFVLINSGGNWWNDAVSARDHSFSYEIFNGHVDTIKFAISACGLIIWSKAFWANGAIQFSQPSGGVIPISTQSI